MKLNYNTENYWDNIDYAYLNDQAKFKTCLFWHNTCVYM